jgi:WD40 repeat protein
MKPTVLLTGLLLIASFASAQQPTQRFKGHTQAPYFVTTGPSGRRAVSTGFDESVRIWNLETKSLSASFKEHRGIVLTAAFNPEETLIATGGLDRSIKLWDVPQSAPSETVDAVSFPVAAAGIGRQAEFLALAGNEGQLAIWNTAEQKIVAELKTTISKPTRVALRSDAQSVAVANDDGMMEIFSGNELQTRTRVRTHLDGLKSLQCFSNNAYYLTVGEDGYFRRWPTSLPETQFWESPSEQVAASAVSDRGDRLVTVTAPNKIRIWDVNQAKAIREINEIKGAVTQPCLSEDSQLLVVIENKRTPHVVQLSDGKILRSLPDFPDDVASLAIAPNKQSIAAGFANGTVRIVNAETGEEQQNFSTGDKAVDEIQWHHQSKQVFAGTAGGAVQRWDVEKAERQAEWKTASAMTSMLVNSRANRIAVGTKDGTLGLLSADKLEPVVEFPKQLSEIVSVDARANADVLISGDLDGTVTVWDAKSAVPKEYYPAGAKNVSGAVRLPDGSVLVTQIDGTIVRQRPTANLTIALETKDPLASVISENSAEIAIAFADGSIQTFNSGNGSPGNPYEGHSGKITVLAYSPNSAYLFAGNEEGLVYQWRISNRRLEQIYKVDASVREITVSRDSTRLMVSIDGNRIRTYSIETVSSNRKPEIPEEPSATLQELLFGEAAPLAFGIRDDHQTAWSVTPDGKSQHWRMAFAKSVATLNGHRGQVYSIAFSPDGTKLVSVSSDKTVRLWDPIEKKAVTQLAEFDDVLYDVAWSPDGKSIFICGAKRLVRELDPETGQIRKNYEGSDETLYTIAVSPDGKQVAAAGTGLGPDREILIWNVGNPQPAKSLAVTTDSVYSVEFDQSRQHVLAVGYNGHVERIAIGSGKSAGVLDVPLVLYSGCLLPDGQSLMLAGDQNDLLVYPLPK